MHHVSWLVSSRCRGSSVCDLRTRHRFYLPPLPWPARLLMSMSHEKGDVLAWSNVSQARAVASLPRGITRHSSRKSNLYISGLLPNALSHVIPKSDLRLGSWSPSGFVAVNVTLTLFRHCTAGASETACSWRIGSGCQVNYVGQWSLDAACDLKGL